MIHRSFACIAIFGFCSYVSRLACAEVSVLIVTPADDEARDYSVYESRLRSELLAAGFSVSTERVPGTPDVASLASNAERSASQAAIAISVSEGELCGLLWIGEEAKGSGLVRPVRCCPLDDAAPLVFAVRATDALSAGLLELRYPREQRPAQEPAAPERRPPPASPKRPEPPPPSPALMRPEPAPARTNAVGPRWHPQASGAVAVWLREFPVAYGVKLELARDFDRWWSAAIQGYALAPTSVIRDSGKADLSQFMAGFAFRYETRLSERLTIVDGLGVGVYAIDARANATVPFGSRRAFSTSGYFSFEHQIHFQVVRSLSVVAGLGVAAPWTRYSVVFVDTAVARAAAPLLLPSLGLQMNL